MARSSTNIESYKSRLNEFLTSLPDEEKTPATRYLARTDLYFLLRYILGRKDIEHPWLFARCREVQRAPNGYLDLWGREHFKSSIITYGLTIQDIIASHGNNPLPQWKGAEPTFGIFSHTRPIAKGFLRQIKREFESNETLRDLFADVIWGNCGREAPKWSEDDGLVLKRKSNPKESTVEAWGLVDGQPTSKHFYVRVYDDVVTIGSVSTPEMIKKTTEAWELSTNLGVDGGIERYIGTRYHYNDSYREIMARGAAKPRIYPATVDGSVDGEPVLLSREALAKKRRDQGPHTFSCQLLQDPKADETQGFKREWLQYWEPNSGHGLNKYIIVDPASEKRPTNDYTAIWVIGLGADGHYYLLDGIRDRLSLTERGDAVFRLHRQWCPLHVGYEKYGIQADIEYLQDRMRRENYRFRVIPLGGQLKKNDRIRRLVPLFEQGRILLPSQLWRRDYEGRMYDLTQVFIDDEYMAFPVSIHDDLLDSLSRICDEDMAVAFPKAKKTPSITQSQRAYNPLAW